MGLHTHPYKYDIFCSQIKMTRKFGILNKLLIFIAFGFIILHYIVCSNIILPIGQNKTI